MRDVFYLSVEQLEQIQSFFPLSHGVPRVDDRKVICGIIYVLSYDSMLTRKARPELILSPLLALLLSTVSALGSALGRLICPTSTTVNETRQERVWQVH